MIGAGEPQIALGHRPTGGGESALLRQSSPAVSSAMLRNTGSAGGIFRNLVLRLGRRSEEPLPKFRPPPGRPNRGAPNRLPKVGHVMGDEEEAERKHPESEKRENREDPAQDEEHTNRYSDPVSARMTQPSHGSSHHLGHLLLEVLEGPPQDELTLAFARISLEAFGPRSGSPGRCEARPP